MRMPVVAGTFYPSKKGELEEAIASCFAKEVGMPKIGAGEAGLAAVVAPHAGYVYSGWVAAFAYAESAKSFKSPPLFVIAGPNHTGQGMAVSISREDWQTPLGVAKNDVEFGKAIVKNSKFAQMDEVAHEFEHSVEVQLPFLQWIWRELKGPIEFVPICLMAQGLEASDDLANAVIKAAAERKREVLFIASSDFTHYESAESAVRKDSLALKKLRELDAEGFAKVVEEKRISICGHGAIAAAIRFARLRGCRSGNVLKYANSGDATGEFSEVVAYCSASFRLR